MGNNLRFILKSLPHPYPYESSSVTEIWGMLSINLLNNGESIMLLETQWDMALLINWFCENEKFIQSEELIICEHLSLSISGSISKHINHLLERDFSEDEEDIEDKWYEEIFNFRQRHALTSALRGANIPDIFVGINHGQGEISLHSHDDSWCYQFDINDFISDFLNQVETFQKAY